HRALHSFPTRRSSDLIRTASEQFEQMTPYVLAIVKLDEGPRFTAQLVCTPEEVTFGMRVRPVFRRIAADGESGVIHYGTKFVPADRKSTHLNSSHVKS